MARQYGRIKVAIWRDEEFRALTLHVQWAFFMLLSQPDLSLCGALAYRPGRWSRLAGGAKPEEVADLVNELDLAGFVLLDLTTEELVVRTFVRHECNLANPKVRTGVEAAMGMLESPILQAAVDQQITDAITNPIGDPDDAGITDPITTGSRVVPQAAGSKSIEQGAGSSSSEQCVAPLAPAAAAAFEMFIDHRMATETPRSPRRYEQTLRRDELVEQRPVLVALAAEGKTAREIVESVWGLTPATIARIPRRNR